jgi:ABC-2 type transport system ATP-binding protein
VIAVEGVHKWYGGLHAVRGVSFELARGQVAGLLGHNGAGKSTTIRMLAGYLMPDLGRVVVEGHDASQARLLAAASLGYLPESTPLYPEMPVSQFLAFRAGLCSVPASRRQQAIDRVLERCWLREVRSRRIGELSKGYKQRVGLAAALLHEPKVLLLDEPTSGLDPSQVRETRHLVRELAQDRTMLISSHVLAEVEAICDRAIIIAGGQVWADGAIAALRREHGARRYRVEARLVTPDELERVWRAVPGVASVVREGDPAPGWGAWAIGMRDDAPATDPREAIAHGAARCGALVRELRSVDASLEQVFIRVSERAALAKRGQDGAEGDSR